MICYSKRIQIKISTGKGCIRWSPGALGQLRAASCPPSGVTQTELASPSNDVWHVQSVTSQWNSPMPWCPGFLFGGWGVCVWGDVGQRGEPIRHEDLATSLQLLYFPFPQQEVQLIWTDAAQIQVTQKHAVSINHTISILYDVAQVSSIHRHFYRAGYPKGLEEPAREGPETFRIERAWAAQVVHFVCLF